MSVPEGSLLYNEKLLVTLSITSKALLVRVNKYPKFGDEFNIIICMFIVPGVQVSPANEGSVISIITCLIISSACSIALTIQ